MKYVKRLLGASALLLVVAGCSAGSTNPLSKVMERWNSANEPELLNSGAAYEITLAKLPLSAKMKTIPWSDTYWPSNQGGISARWNAADPQSFSYVSPSLQKLKSMTSKEIAALSPAEKYDILVGRYDYPTVKSERARTSSSAESWEGLCHGWAPAAQLFSEPKPTVMTNADGVAVAFGSADVKALLTYYQGQVARNTETRFLASRCNIDISRNPSDAQLPECRDVNAGTFHIVLANQLSRNQPFVADVTRDLQVWNQPVYGFESKTLGTQPPSPGAAAGTVREVIVQTKMVYGVEISAQWEALGNAQQLATKNYEYRLEMSASGQILGGEWISEERPDFVWSQTKPAFTGYFSQLEKVYLASTGAVTQPTPRPTVAPTASPTAVPTVSPTAVPTVLPLPTRTPVPPAQLTGYCPEGWTLKALPANSSVKYCAQGSVALGPVTETMLNECLNSFSEDCYQANWNEATYLKFRGSDRCIKGSSFDEQTGYCLEADFSGTKSIFGPFSKELVQRCLNAGGGNACKTMRWNKNFALPLLVR